MLVASVKFGAQYVLPGMAGTAYVFPLLVSVLRSWNSLDVLGCEQPRVGKETSCPRSS